MEGQGLPPDRVIAASRQRLMQTQQERARTKTLLQVGKILEADTPDRLDLRKQHLLARTDMAQVVDPETVTELSGARVSDLSARARRAFERVLGVNNLVSAAFLPLGTYVRRTVGRIEVRNRVQRLGWGTGFLVSPQLLLTNNHVLSDRDSARFSHVEFDYAEGFNRRIPLTWVFQLDPDALFLTSDAEEGLD
jgi:endonuclease G